MEKAKSEIWHPGTVIRTQLKRIDWDEPKEADLTVIKYAGSGFGVRAYQAKDENGNQLALRVYRSSGWKEGFRDFLHRRAWGLTYPGRFLEAAVMTSEGWQLIFERAIKVENLDQICFTKNYGHFFNPEFGSFVSAAEWMEGESQRPPVVHTQAEQDWQFKRFKMEEFRRLAQRIGFIKGERQWDFGTLVAPLNGVIVREDGVTKVGIRDITPGLPVLQDMPLSPSDIFRVAKMFLLDAGPWFDQVDFRKLDAYIAEHGEQFADLFPVVRSLKEADALYRASLPSALTYKWRNILSTEKRRLVREGAVSAFLAEGLITQKKADFLRRSDMGILAHLLVYNIPLIGTTMQRLLFNSEYQQHLLEAMRERSLIYKPLKLTMDKEYRNEWLLGIIEEDMEKGEIAPELAEKLVKQADDKKADQTIRDITLTTVVNNAAATFIALGLIGIGTITGDELIRDFGIFQLPWIPKPIGLGSTIRALWLADRVIHDHLSNRDRNIHYLPIWIDGLLIAGSSLSVLGNLAPPLRAAGILPELSVYLTTRYLNKVISKVPVFGKGTVVEALIYEKFYNPLIRWLLKLNSTHNTNS